MDNWISVNKPPDNEDYIFLVDVTMIDYYGYLPCLGYYDLTDNVFFDVSDTRRPSTTHWQPTMDPPETK